MPRTLYTVLVVAAALVAVFLGSKSTNRVAPPPALHKGRNNTVLFITDSHHGRVNVHLATLLGVLESQPQLDLHYASFSNMASTVSRIAESHQHDSGQSAPQVQWHEIPGHGLAEGSARNLGYSHDQLAEALTLAPGVKNTAPLVNLVISILSAWKLDEYKEMYHAVYALVEKIDPSLIVTDAALSPVLSAIRNLNRKSAYVSPDMLTLGMAMVQPQEVPPWSYPFMGSGFEFPMTWSEALANTWIFARLAFAMVTDGPRNQLHKDLSKLGIPSPIDMQTDAQALNITLISAGFQEGSLPIRSLPKNMITCGPLVLDHGKQLLSQQDPELASWLQRAPTVLINLGSIVKYDAISAQAIVSALLPVFEQTDVQVLWKFRPLASIKDENFTKQIFKPVQQYVDNGRMRAESWLTVDPPTLLMTGNIVLSVHHGGASSFNEPLWAGIPQIVLPMWADCYNFATQAEYLGIGLWANKKTAPQFNAEELGTAFLSLLGKTSKTAASTRQKAAELGRIARSYGGRECAAKVVAEMAIVNAEEEVLG